MDSLYGVETSCSELEQSVIPVGRVASKVVHRPTDVSEGVTVQLE